MVEIGGRRLVDILNRGGPGLRVRIGLHAFCPVGAADFIGLCADDVPAPRPQNTPQERPQRPMFLAANYRSGSRPARAADYRALLLTISRQLFAPNRAQEQD